MNSADMISRNQAAAMFGAVEEKPERIYGTGNKDQAAMMLGRGMSPQNVARVLGISRGLISQYKQDEGFKLEVADMLMERNLATSLRDERIDNLEDSAIGRLEDVMQFISKPMELVAVLKTVNSLVRRSSPEMGMDGELKRDVVTVELPRGMIGKVTLEFNTSNEVVQANGREMRTIDSVALIKGVDKGAKSIDGKLAIPAKLGCECPEDEIKENEYAEFTDTETDAKILAQF